MVEMDEVLAFLEAKKRGENLSQSWTQLKNVQLKDGTTIGELTIDSPELEAKIVAQVLDIEEVSPPVPIVQSSNFPETLLSEVIEQFCSENVSLGACPRTNILQYGSYRHIGIFN